KRAGGNDEAEKYGPPEAGGPREFAASEEHWGYVALGRAPDQRRPAPAQTAADQSRIDHCVAVVPSETAQVKDVPSINQSTCSPVTVFCQRRSGEPSASKSPVPAIDQSVEIVPSSTLSTNVVPFISQITRSPVTVFCQRMSGEPS